MNRLELGHLIDILDATPGYVAIFEPILDESSVLQDLELVWWNTAYANLFVSPPVRGQRMMDTYHRPVQAREFARRAIVLGRVHQRFSIDRGALAGYLHFDRPTDLSVDWIVVGPYVVEVGEDVTHLNEIQNQLKESDLELLEAWRQREIAESKQEMARNMHDSVIQRLLAVGIGIHQTLDRRHLTESERDLAELVIRNLDDAVHELRSIVGTLKSPGLDDTPPTDLNRELLDVFHSVSPMLGHRPGYTYSVTCPISADVRGDIEAVVREALTNVAKHASATRSLVRVECNRSTLTVAIFDNGIGIESDPLPGHGLVNLQERAARYGGHLDIGRRHDRPGTRLTWTIPCPDASNDVDGPA